MLSTSWGRYKTSLSVLLMSGTQRLRETKQLQGSNGLKLGACAVNHCTDCQEKGKCKMWKHLTESEHMDMWSLTTTQGLVEQVLAYAVIWRMQGELCFQSPPLFSSIPAGRAKFASLWNHICLSPRSSLVCVVFQWQLHPLKHTR